MSDEVEMVDIQIQERDIWASWYVRLWHFVIFSKKYRRKLKAEWSVVIPAQSKLVIDGAVSVVSVENKETSDAKSEETEPASKT